MKKLLPIFFLLLTSFVYADNGILFQHLEWKEAIKKAKAEKKLIFIDFYTQWCGPCKVMADEVFITRAVGDLYNNNFINLKIDAESETGSVIAKKYGVKVYPTFVFVDPQTEEAAHVSTSRQDEDIFLFTGQSALSKDRNSVYLNKLEKEGASDPTFLYNMAYYHSSFYSRETADKYFNKLLAVKGYDLSNPKVWEYFTRFIKMKNHPLSQELIANRSKYAALYGAQPVENQVYALYRFERDFKTLESAQKFRGQNYLICKMKFDEAMKSKNYTEAKKWMEKIFANDEDRTKEICADIEFMVRLRDTKEVIPAELLEINFRLAQFAAHNFPDRDNGTVHYNYAKFLEYMITNNVQNAKELIEKPVSGVAEYSMRSQGLKPKPQRKTTK